MAGIRQFAAAFFVAWLLSVTGGLIAGLLVLLAAFGAPIPWWVYLIGVMVGLIKAAYAVWAERQGRVAQLEERLRPRLEIASVPVINDEWRFQVRVRNRSGTTVRFAARMEAVDPQIDYPLPVHLQLTHHAEHQAEIPPYGEALVNVFRDNPFVIPHPHDAGQDDESINFLFFGHPPGAVSFQRIRYLVRICAYPVNPEHGIAAIRSFHIIPQFQKRCIFGDAGEAWQEPV